MLVKPLEVRCQLEIVMIAMLLLHHYDAGPRSIFTDSPRLPRRTITPELRQNLPVHPDPLIAPVARVEKMYRVPFASLFPPFPQPLSA